MSYIQAIILGIVQGITEFLPISSSGHLVIFQEILGMEMDNSVTFEVILHFGTLLAVIAVYFQDVIMLIREGFGLLFDIVKFIGSKVTGKKAIELVRTEDRKLTVMVLVASVPTALIGFLLQDVFENYLMNLLSVGCALLLTGTLLLFTDKVARGKKTPDKATYKDAFIVGLFQSMAITPGLTRSGSTIFAGLLRGFDKEFAIRFSFLCFLPAVGGVSVLKLSELSMTDISSTGSMYLLGMICSAIVGFICIKTLLLMLKKNKFHYFAYYCYIVGILSIGWSLLK